MRLWVGRMLLEVQEHPFSAFVTLTFNPENLPDDGSVRKVHLQDFLRKLRTLVEPRKIRYYAVGEYGDRSFRPHYHAILFGVSPMEQEVVEKAWGKGFVMCGTVEGASIGYVMGYVLKKMLKKTDFRLKGREPEFCLMSRHPGIGAKFADRMGVIYHEERGKAALNADCWYQTQFRISGGVYPLGRYLQGRLEKILGLSKDDRENHRFVVEEKLQAERLKEGTLRFIARRASKVAAQEGKQKASEWRRKGQTL